MRTGLVLGPRVGITGKLGYLGFHITIIMQLALTQRGGAIASFVIAKKANNSGTNLTSPELCVFPSTALIDSRQV